MIYLFFTARLREPRRWRFWKRPVADVYGWLSLATVDEAMAQARSDIGKRGYEIERVHVARDTSGDDPAKRDWTVRMNTRVGSWLGRHYVFYPPSPLWASPGDAPVPDVRSRLLDNPEVAIEPTRSLGPASVERAMTPYARVALRRLGIIGLAWALGAGCAARDGTQPVAPASELGCNREPGNNFFWVERAFCDLPTNGPENAHGIIVWNHGISGTTEAWRAPVPPVFRLLQVRGWDVVIIKRHNLAEADANVSLYRSVERTLEQVRQERQRGYRKIVLAGQSFGGYITLDAAERSADVFGVIAMAPGVRETNAAGRPLDPTVTERGLQRLKVERVALVFPKDDALFGSFVRGPGAEKMLRGRPNPYLLLDETSGLTGHGGGTGGKFAFLYGLCLSEFLTAPTLPAGRFACSAPEARAVITDLVPLKEGAPKLLEDPNRAPAEVRALAGRWYALLEDTFIFFALVDHGGSQPRVLYRTAAARLGGGTYDATIANGRIGFTLPNRSTIVVELTPAGPTLTWTSADGVRVVKAPLMKVEEN